MYMRDRARGGYKAVKLERIAAALFLLAVVSPEAGGQRPEAQRLRVLFLGDNGHHRPTQRAQQILPALARNGIDLFYTDRLEDLTDSELDRYQALVLYNNHLNVGEAQLASLMRFVGDGGGLVVIHCASASFQNSEEFIRLVGAAFKSHGTGTFSAIRTEAAHPAVAGVPVIESWDETYLHTKHNPVNRTVLEVRRENGHDEPWTWVRTYGKGRVFYTAWGHDQRTWGNRGFQQMIGQGIRWTVGDWALTQIARDPDTRQVKLEVPLPTYKRPPAPWNILDTAITVAQAALSTTESLRMMTLRPHFRAEPFATEPMIGNIIDFTWDARGRMWAVETNDYPNTVLPDSVPGNDRILIIEDANRDGRADRVKVFATGLNLATSLTFANGGLIVGQAPHMLFFKDTDGDDKADERKILFTGWPRTDTHGAISNLRYGFDNQVWGSVGYNGFRGTVGNTTYDRGQFGAGYFRFPTDLSTLDYVARTSNNTWGVAFTEDGFVFGSTANSRPSNFVHIPIRYYRGIGDREPVLPDIADRLDVFPQIDILQVDQFGRYTAGAAHEIYTARAFPREYWNRAAFVAEPTAHVIGQFDLSDNGSGFRARNRWSFMSARDAWVAPVQVKVGPDGAVWVSDFYTLVAQHNPTPRNMMGCCQTGPGQAYETPNRDRLHGRIYRIVYDSARQAAPKRLDTATPAQLVAALDDDNLFWRQTAQRLLVERKATDAIPALVRRASDHTVDSLGLNTAALHALWTLHGLGALTSSADAMTAARNALRHPAASVRRAALMMLPRDTQLLTDILSAGILPDRGSPWPVEYTVSNSILSDADLHVRLEATLAMSELPPSDRSANVVRELFGSLDNARDPWMPDAIAIAAAGHGPAFLGELMLQRVPQNADSITVNGLRRVVQRLARLHSTKAEIGPVVSLINTIPRAHAGLATALLEGIATGWPEERRPELTPEQRVTLVEAARSSAAELGPAFDRVAARWTIPNVFRVP
jgi:putative membrane-bound dehydrogenase-like protein